MDHHFMIRQMLPHRLEHRSLEGALAERLFLARMIRLSKGKHRARLANLHHQCEPDAFDGTVSQTMKKLPSQPSGKAARTP